MIDKLDWSIQCYRDIDNWLHIDEDGSATQIVCDEGLSEYFDIPDSVIHAEMVLSSIATRERYKFDIGIKFDLFLLEEHGEFWFREQIPYRLAKFLSDAHREGNFYIGVEYYWE